MTKNPEEKSNSNKNGKRWLGHKNSATGKRPKITKEERRKKYTDIARSRRQRQNGLRGGTGGGNNKNKLVCYNCRQSGHTAAECPSLGNSNSNTNKNTNNYADHSTSSVAGGILCYKCGSTEHALHHCPKRNSNRGNSDRHDLPYAICFVCQKKGHLASSCPKNMNGIYINGGCCKTCGSLQHIAKFCPEKRKNKKKEEEESSLNKDDVDHEKSKSLIEDLLESEPDCCGTGKGTNNNRKTSTEKKKQRRVVNF